MMARAKAFGGGAFVLAASTLTAALVGACGSSDDAAPSPSQDAGPGISLGDASFEDAGYVDGSADEPHPTPNDGGYSSPDGGFYPADRFVMKVVSVTQGECGGFGAAKMPDVVMGPPVGAGDEMGSLDVFSLGKGGEIVVSFEPNAIVDGPGADFIVFENAFFASGDPSLVAADLGEVSVSEDGTTWHTFPCTIPDASSPKPPFGTCAGWHPVYSSPQNGISPFDVEKAGGDPFDLADLGVPTARFVKIRDRATIGCPSGGASTTAGFDLDAISLVNSNIR